MSQTLRLYWKIQIKRCYISKICPETKGTRCMFINNLERLSLFDASRSYSFKSFSNRKVCIGGFQNTRLNFDLYRL